ncbi:hypothetical protein C8R46DRAFT_181915 [Mycena filopes]|nr:hypothetical protein C8R46DRAFT_181915 [Mycena filopes]
MPDLPQELIEAIVKEVPLGSLAACSLTAIAFVTASQRRLFRWMSLPNIAAYQRAEKLLASSPHLGPYFRYLALGITEIPDDFSCLKSILSVLSEIEFLTITGSYTTPHQMGKNPFLIDFLSHPTLRCLGLSHLGEVPASLVTRAFSLFDEVQLGAVTIVNDEDLASDGPLPPAELWHLAMSGDGAEIAEQTMLAFLLQPKRIQSLELQQLSFVFPPVPADRAHRFEELLVACSDSLDSLELELETPPTYIPTLPNLTYLELWLDVELTKTPPEMLAIIAAAVASAPHLEVLTIAFLDRPANPRRPHRQLWTGAQPEWAPIDSALMDMKDLCEVVFSLRWFHHEPERYAAFTPFIQAHLPRSFEAGFVDFSYRACQQHPMDKFVSIY